MSRIIPRRNIFSSVAAPATLASANDLDGTVDGTQVIKVNGRKRIIVYQVNDGTAGTAGIDVIEVSRDGATWKLDPTLMVVANADDSDSVAAGAALNAAGVEPTHVALFKSGPHSGPTFMRCGRGGAGAGGTAWVTGAPSVLALVVG